MAAQVGFTNDGTTYGFSDTNSYTQDGMGLGYGVYTNNANGSSGTNTYAGGNTNADTFNGSGTDMNTYNAVGGTGWYQ